MNKIELLKTLEDTLELDPGTMRDEVRLQDLPTWDSMQPLAIMAMADKRFGRTITAKDIQQCKTVAELILLFGDLVSD
jgi:acyl carrier protein